MTAPLVYTPRPILWSAMSVGDVDTRALLWAGALDVGDSVVAVLAVIIRRVDLVAMVDGVDLEFLPPPLIEAGGLVTTVELLRGQGGVTYSIGFRVTTAFGRTLTRYALQPVVVLLG